LSHLTRDAILTANDIRTEEVDVPEWGGVVLVRGMTGTERDAFEARVVETHGKTTRVNLVNFRAKFVASVCVDDAGQPLFTEADIAALGKKSAAALQRVFNVAQRLSGLSDEDVDELVKKSENGQSADSGSA
jgi:hypothetical protein